MLNVLRKRDFGLLFSGQVVSQIGDYVLFVALPFWIYQLTGSATATGIIFASLALPRLILGPVAGVFVDRWNRKTTMIVADLLRAGIMLAYLTVNSAEQAWIIYVLAFAESCVSRFFFPAVTAIVPLLVTTEELAPANAALGISNAVARLAGPALGGALVAVAGPHGAATFDAASYLVSGVAIALMRIPPLRASAAPRAAEGVRAIVHELIEGMHVVAKRQILRAVFASVGVFLLADGITTTLLVVMVSRVWGAGATELGWLLSGQGVGAVIGGAVIGGVATRFAPRWLAVLGGICAGVGLLAMVNQSSVYVAIALVAATGFMIVAAEVGWDTLLQLGSDDDNRGRVSALLSTVAALSTLFAIAVTSAIADRVGAVTMLDAGGLAMIAGGLIALAAPNTVATNAVPAWPQPAE